MTEENSTKPSLQPADATIVEGFFAVSRLIRACCQAVRERHELFTNEELQEVENFYDDYNALDLKLLEFISTKLRACKVISRLATVSVSDTECDIPVAIYTPKVSKENTHGKN